MPDLLLRNAAFLAAGLWTTLTMAAWTAALGTLLAIPVALARHAQVPVLGRACAAYVAVIQGTPVLVVLLLAYVALPALLGYRTTAYVACVAGFTVFLAAYAAEDLRAGLRAVPAPLTEAGTALGLSRAQVLRTITLPLATRAALPALIGQYVRMVKYTSVAAVIGVPDLTGATLLVNARVFQPLPLLGTAAAAYFVICLGLSTLARRLQRRLAIA